MSENSVQEVVLPAIVDLDSLDAIRDRVLEAVDHGAAMIDASAVERVATNGLLMLLCAADSAERNNNLFTVKNLSEPMKSAVQRLGLSPHFSSLDKG